MRHRPAVHPLRTRLGLLALAVLAPAVLAAGVSGAGPAAPAAATAAAPAARAGAGNPLAGRTMGVYRGPMEQSWAPYQRATGAKKELLAKIALRPKAKWFGAWVRDADIERKVEDYIANATGGDPNVLVQMAVFRMVPWEHDACKRLPSKAQKKSYRRWIRGFARGVGNAHAALILQPDGPFALCVPKGSKVPSRMIRYAAKRLAALPNTSVYIDAGAGDWPKDRPDEAARFLMPAGIEYVRGFALNSTHYSPTSVEIGFGTRLVEELARRGVPGRHFVINTSSNGKGFDFGTARGKHPDHAKVCRSRSDSHCVTLGIPPTTDVTSPRWGLSAADSARAAAHVDAYLWFGRPWLFMQADPFLTKRALRLVRTTPY